MTKRKKLTVLLGKAAAAPTLFLLVLLAGSMTAYAAESYDLYIGNTQVTDSNKDNILGDGKASYDADTKTLTLNGVYIDTVSSHALNYDYNGENVSLYNHESANFSLYAGTDVVKNLVITGNNTFVSTGSQDVGNGGIFFSVSGPIGMTPPFGPDEPKNYNYIYYSLIITGNGTLTSTATDGNTGTAMTVEGAAAANTGYLGGVIMGEEDGTGPTLKLIGWDTGADFSFTGRFHMRGGTIIAEAKNPTMGTGVYLADGRGNFNSFEGGTIAGCGTYGYDESNYVDGYGAFNEGYEGGGFDTTIAQNHGMQCVYPEGTSNNLNEISGWAVVGMTADGFKDKTNAVLVELGLAERTDPVAGENGPYHTDVVPDPGVYFDVQGYTKDGTIYSVDVEWGAMTFQYEKSSWDPESHTSIPGRGWVVYDNVNDKVIDSKQDAINKITVTNRSNAEVYATLSYAGNDGYADIGGDFTKSADDTATQFTDKAATTPAYLTLATAENGEGEGGANKETVGTVYFMPEGIGTTGDTVNDIPQWTVIGKITVGLLTEQP